jgi:hypothetical protein
MGNYQVLNEWTPLKWFPWIEWRAVSYLSYNTCDGLPWTVSWTQWRWKFDM